MARTADPPSYARAVTYVYGIGIPVGVLRPDDRAVREIEDALRKAERSGDDLAVSSARLTLGLALVHRPTDAEHDHGHKFLAEVSDVFLRQGRHLAELRLVNVYLAREGCVEIPMTPLRSWAPPPTICYTRDNCWGGAFQ